MVTQVTHGITTTPLFLLKIFKVFFPIKVTLYNVLFESTFIIYSTKSLGVLKSNALINEPGIASWGSE